MIGEKIRILRKNKKMTQAELAEALSVSSQSVSKWENGLSVPDISVLPAIARYFGITMDELFDYRLDSLNYKERFISFMVNNGMLRFGNFTLKSGRVSPYLIHSGYNLTGSQISKLGEFYAECIKEHGIESNCLFGTGAREIPLVIATSMTLFNKYGADTFHCVDFDIESDAFGSRDITMITDAFTSGATLSAALEKIHEKTGKYPSHAVVCVDRTESADNTSVSAKRMIEDRYGVKIHPIVTAFDILKAAEKGVISAGEYTEKLKEYITHYKGE